MKFIRCIYMFFLVFFFFSDLVMENIIVLFFIGINFPKYILDILGKRFGNCSELPFSRIFWLFVLKKYYFLY